MQSRHDVVRTGDDSGLDPAANRLQLYDVMRQDLGLREKASRALELGRQYLGVENGHLTLIDPAAGYWTIVESTDPDEGAFTPGRTIALEKTYCRRTIHEEEPIAVSDAPNQGWADDPAFEVHGLHTYCGAAIIVDGAVTGTVCFVSGPSRESSFAEDEVMLVELIARLLEHCIEQERSRRDVRERTEMVRVLSRVLRHNLRNDLNVIRGHAELLRDQPAVDLETATDTIVRTIDDLVAMTDKTQQLQGLLQDPFPLHDIDVRRLVRRITADVGATHPDASVTVTIPDDAELRAAPQLETALRELVENAARHAGDAPSIEVAVTREKHSLDIEVRDDGPGLPEQERNVLRVGDETPLNHGEGLGLWLVYWIVTRHDGQVETSVSDSGTTVTVSIPYGSPGLPSLHPAR